MSFQVKFNSESNLAEDSSTSRGMQILRGNAHLDIYGDGQKLHFHRGRGRGNRGRRPTKRGGGQSVQTTAVDDDPDGTDESDGANSVSSEGQGRQKRRGGKWKGKGDRGRGNRNRNVPKGEHSFERRRGSCDALRSPPEETTLSAQKESHIHYYTLSQSVPRPALPQHQQMAPYVVCPPQQSPVPFGPHPLYPFDPDQPGLLPNTFPLTGPRNMQRSHASSPMQPYPQVYPQQSYAECLPSQQKFNHPVPAHYNERILKQPLLSSQPPYSTENHHSVGQPFYQQSPQGPSNPPLLLDPQQMAEIGEMTGPARRSRQNLSQKPSGQRSARDVRPQKKEGKKENYGQKLTGGDLDQQDRKPGTKNKQELVATGTESVEIPDLSSDEWIKIFDHLLKEFKGRTKLGTLLSRKGNLLTGVSHIQAAAWLKHSHRFLTNEKNGQIKFVSVYFREARLCFKYKKHNTDKCENNQCPFFHMCRDYISGNCLRQASCHFSHSFHTKSNAKLTAEIGLQDFTDEEIRIIVLRSTPVVCDKFNKCGCNGDCPDLHVCARFIRKKCSNESCKLGHRIKGTEHNDWILEAFHMQKIEEHTLLKMVIVLNEESGQDCGDRKSECSAPDEASKGAIPKKVTDKTAQRTKQQSKENGSDESLPITVQLDTNNTQGKRPRPRKPRQPKGKYERSSCSTSDLSVANGAQVEILQRADHYGSDKLDSLAEQNPTPDNRSSGPEAAYVLADIATEVEEEQRALPASHYTHLCEDHTWTGSCRRGYLCPRYHHRHRPPIVWQMHARGDWRDFSESDSIDIEKHFCALESEGLFEVVVDNFGGMQLSLDFSAMTARVVSSTDTSVASLDLYGMHAAHNVLKIRRWSTPSYVDSEAGVPLSYYSQWIWYQMSDAGIFQPFIPGTLQYTVEEKYISGQQKYYFEVDEQRFVLQLQDMKLVNLNQDVTLPVLRRPFFSLQEQADAAPLMSSMLLSDLPDCHHSDLPSHWGIVDKYQDFEMVELEPSSSDCLGVERSFHSTLSRERATILRVFRVQSPSLWDKYCSTKRSMTPRGGSSQDVDERKLFHGTPTLLAVRGICTNNMDFRRAGENVGAMFGKGSYFSAHAVYSHSYTQGPDRYMFLAKVLVGKFTKGQPSYAFPPLREGLKQYDSCVNDEANPTIFVIFDLTQSYPEYLVQYTDAEMGPGGHSDTAQVSGTGSRLCGPGAKSQGPGPKKSTGSAVFDISKPVSEESVRLHQMRDQFKKITSLGFDTNSAAPLHYEQQKLKYQNPNSEGSGLDRHDPILSGLGQAVMETGPSRPQAKSAGRSSSKKTNSDKCLLS